MIFKQELNREDAPPDPHRAPLRVAICGEVNSGKSTVLNAILRARSIGDNLGRTERPTVVARYRATPGVVMRDATGREIDAAEVEEGWAVPSEIYVYSAQPHLQGFEFVEVPLSRPEDVNEEQIGLIATCDVMIWVTIASQAWRLTEKTMIERLGPARPSDCLLAISRGDKLRNDTDRAKLKARVQRESAAYFSRVAFLYGSRDLLREAETSDEAFQRSGGAALIAALGAMTGRAVAGLDTLDPETEADLAIGTHDAPSPLLSEHGGAVLPFRSRSVGKRASQPANSGAPVAPPGAEPEFRPDPHPVDRTPEVSPRRVTRSSKPGRDAEREPARESGPNVTGPVMPDTEAEMETKQDSPLLLATTRLRLGIELPEGLQLAGRIGPSDRILRPVKGSSDEIVACAKALENLMAGFAGNYTTVFGGQLDTITEAGDDVRIMFASAPETGLTFAQFTVDLIDEPSAHALFARLAGTSI
ncbi:hypothetical protein BMI91_14530 [Thioclava sediminum]|uniref:G domain-containing protein n=1 Tax=Thioclava sediminum TaxID=1915319 RepID=A0ABX3MVG4_9RHOB|nr:GTPase [Thioclava sediminum]OOY23681.1 hypothetical protein BMI91_14530 [Thioclava sediminum]